MASGVRGVPLDPYTEEAVASSLMESPPVAGKISSEIVNDEFGFTELILSNGVKVVLKSTDFKNDEIRMTAFSWGGQSVYGNEDNMSARYASSIISNSGVAEFSTSDLRKVMTGKIVSVSPAISGTWEGFGGSCAPKDLKSMLQLAHLYYTQPRKDPEAFQSFMAKQISLYQNQLSDPMNYFFEQYRCRFVFGVLGDEFSLDSELEDGMA